MMTDKELDVEFLKRKIYRSKIVKMFTKKELQIIADFYYSDSFFSSDKLRELYQEKLEKIEAKKIKSEDK